MPRYCAVKACRNRGGTANKEDDSERISFYRFPLQDQPRLQKWVDNMKREDWTPSQHQYLCSKHFTEDCFDIRWGIRYLRNTAIPTVFPSTKDENKKTVAAHKRKPKAKHRIEDTQEAELPGLDSPNAKRPLILSKKCPKVQSSPLQATSNTPAEQTEDICELPEELNASVSNASEIQTPETTPCPTVSPHSEPHPVEQGDTAVVVLCCETLASFCDAETNVNAATLQAALGHVFSFTPVETVKDKATGCCEEESEPGEGELVSALEHSYCRAVTDKDQLWCKILRLNAKISAMDRREESTVAKIRALETEIALLKKDGAVFKEKQRILEDFIVSELL